MGELAGEFPPQTAGFGQDLLASLFGEGQQQFLILQGTEESKAALVVKDDMAHRGQKLIPQPRASLGIELLATGPQQVELQETVGQGHEDHLIDHQREGPGAKIGKVPETLELAMPLLNGCAQTIVPTHLSRVPHFLGIQEHPQLLSAVGISLPVDNKRGLSTSLV